MAVSDPGRAASEKRPISHPSLLTSDRDRTTLCFGPRESVGQYTAWSAAQPVNALAVDVGGSHVSCAAVHDSELVRLTNIETDSQVSLGALLPALHHSLGEIDKLLTDRPAGIAFGFCGLVDPARGKIVSTNRKYPDATEFDLVAWARERFGLRLILENDARLALLGEWHAGAARGYNDVVMMTLGTGIGTAVISEGRVLRGKHYQAGCLGGHFTVDIHGRRCSCGAFGCFEAESSTYALPGVCQSWRGFETSPLAQEEKLNFERLFYWADRGDPVAEQLRKHCVEIWAACALSLVHAYDPELLLLGGGVMQGSYPLLEAIESHLSSYAWTPWGKIHVRRAALGSNAALLGAVPLLQEYA
jgi:glucokinase